VAEPLTSPLPDAGLHGVTAGPPGWSLFGCVPFMWTIANQAVGFTDGGQVPRGSETWKTL